MQGEYGKIIGGRIIQDGSQDGKDKNGQLESYPIFIIYAFVSLREVLSFVKIRADSWAVSFALRFADLRGKNSY